MLFLILLLIHVHYLQINSKNVETEQNRIQRQVNAFIITYDCASSRFYVTKENIEQVFPNYFRIYCFKSIPLNDSRIHTSSSSVLKKFSSNLLSVISVWTYEIPKYSKDDNQWSFVFEDDVNFIEPSKFSLPNYINVLQELMQNPEIQINDGVFYLGICGPTFSNNSRPLISKTTNNTLLRTKGFGWCAHGMGLTTKRAKDFWIEMSLYRPTPDAAIDYFIREFCIRSRSEYYTLGSNVNWPLGLDHFGIAFQDRRRFPSQSIFKSNIHHNTKWIQNGFTVAGGNGVGNKLDQLNYPYGLYVDDNQAIYIADIENHRIMKWACGEIDDQVVDGENEERNEMNQLNCPTDAIIDKGKDNFIIYEEDNIQGVRSSRRNGTNEQISISNTDCGELTMNNDEYLYVWDEKSDEGNRWKMTDTCGTLVAGGNGKGNQTNQLNRPLHVIVDKETNSLIICDYDNRRVVRWPCQNSTSEQTIISNIDCRGLAMDNSGYLYVCDGEKDEITRWKIGDINGILVAGGNGKGNNLNQLNYPTSIFVDEDRSVYVTDCLNHRVVKWMEGAKEGLVVAGDQGEGDDLTQLSYPEGVIVDHLGTVYVSDRNNNRIVRWYKGATQGNIVVGGNGKGEEPNQLNSPYGLSFDREGNIYVVDCCNQRIQRFNIDRS